MHKADRERERERDLKFGRRNNVQCRRPEVPSAAYKEEAELNEAPVSFLVRVLRTRVCIAREIDETPRNIRNNLSSFSFHIIGRFEQVETG